MSKFSDKLRNWADKIDAVNLADPTCIEKLSTDPIEDGDVVLGTMSDDLAKLFLFKGQFTAEAITLAEELREQASIMEDEPDKEKREALLKKLSPDLQKLKEMKIGVEFLRETFFQEVAQEFPATQDYPAFGIKINKQVVGIPAPHKESRCPIFGIGFLHI